MEKIIIESDIVIPPKIKESIYPLAKMKVGDSFFVMKKINTVASSCSLFIKYKNPKWKFTCRKEKDGTRVWRIK